MKDTKRNIKLQAMRKQTNFDQGANKEVWFVSEWIGNTMHQYGTVRRRDGLWYACDAGGFLPIGEPSKKRSDAVNVLLAHKSPLGPVQKI